MQVKKFEARTMKEALEMVKTQLGPEAIILSARDNNKSFGLVGEGSVEITAAVSEETLQKKKFTESRLRDQDRELFLKSPARQQKELITKMVDKHVQKNQPPPPITQRRYIEIDEEETTLARQQKISEERVRASAQRALQAFQEQEETFQVARRPLVPAPAPVKTSSVPAILEDSEAIRALKNEIANLKQVINQFQQMPQNFVGSHPGADYGINYDLSAIFTKLTNAGVAPEITAEILTRAQETVPALKM
ncbi:MAG TPA: hypothetical protein VN132_14555, partial [Bdellovibrio sp.]|nr:hypothetical protein [Bdellovibrio sp.]